MGISTSTWENEPPTETGPGSNRHANHSHHCRNPGMSGSNTVCRAVNLNQRPPMKKKITPTYIQRRDGRNLETVDEFDTRKEARAMLRE